MSHVITRRRVLASAAALAAGRLLEGCAAPAPPARSGASSAATPPGLHYRFRLGDFEVITISDAGAVLDGPWPIVGEDQPPAEVERLMREHLLPGKKFQPGFTPTVVNTGREIVLFDTGNGADGFVPRPDGGWLAAQLQPAGVAPEQVDVVVLTHSHPDHVGGLLEAGRPLFPNARYVMGDMEHRFWSSDKPLSAPPGGNEYKTGRLFRSHVAPFGDRLTLVRPGGEVVPGIHAVEAYGHTPGHLAFHIESRGRRLLFWGDCAHHEVASLAHPEWHAFFDMDKEAGAATRKRIYDMAVTERLAVVGYHTSFPSVGFVQRERVGFRWVPVTYQFRV